MTNIPQKKSGHFIQLLDLNIFFTKKIVFSDMMYLSFSCEDKLNMNVNGETIKDFGTFNPQSFSIATQSDRTTIEYITTEIR